jgi:peptidoglycan/xylan/chitin deacetylase (PgdA/CDA1 family)
MKPVRGKQPQPLYHFLLILTAFSWLFLVPEPVQADPPPEVTILIYHRFGEEKYPTTNVSTERFREQMAYLLANNYRIMSLGDLIGAISEKKSLPTKTVVITIDDGFKSVYTQAWPILRSFKFPFTVFINAKSIDRGFNDYMSWDEIRELAGSGVDFQDHSYAHARLVDVPEGMDDEQYRNWISSDLVKSSLRLIKELGNKPRFFAIPYGEHNLQVIEEARKIGYEAIFTQDPGSVSQYSDLFLLSREPILGNNWSTMKHFEEVLKRVDLPAQDLTPPPGKLASDPSSFGATILKPDLYEPSSFRIYVSELGWQNAVIDGDRVSIGGGKELTRRLNRVMIRAREKGTGRTAIRSWLLVNN